MKKLILLAVLLTGCAHKGTENRQASIEGTCRSYGITSTHPQYSDCMMRVDQADKDRKQQLRQAYIANGGFKPNVMKTYSYQAPINQEKQTNCVSTGYGGFNCTTR